MIIKNSYKPSKLPFVPYVYFIQHIPSGVWYVGSKYAKSAHPSNFLKTYFTSSVQMQAILATCELKDIRFKILKTFNNKDDTAAYEQRLIIKLSAVKDSLSANKDSNQESNKCIQNKYDTRKISNPETGKCIAIKINSPIPEGWIEGNVNHHGAKNVDERKWYHDPITKTSHHIDPKITSTDGLVYGRGPHYKSNSETLINKNLIWITDGVNNKLMPREEIIPIGFKKGRTKSEKEKESNIKAIKNRIGMRYYNNGTITKQFRDTEVPTGYVLGHLTLKLLKAK